jgi:hypothetical protein
MGALMAGGIAAGSVPHPAAGQASRPAPTASAPVHDVLSPSLSKRVDNSVARALAWLATQQQADGSFPSLETGQPAVTALCALAYLACGHVPDEKQYGEVLNKAIEFVLSSQQPDGLLARVSGSMPGASIKASRSSNYNHAIAGVMLSEVYGMTSGEPGLPIQPALEKALKYAYQRLPQPKRDPIYNGGWRYQTYNGRDDADLTVTSWHLMFLRSCRNSGFQVPTGLVDDAIKFVEKLHRPDLGTFVYAPREPTYTRALAGAAILSFSLGGRHEDERARQAGKFLLEHPFDEFNVRIFPTEHFFYSCFYSSQAMFQLGGAYWREFYPVLAQTLTDNQRSDGSWDDDSHTFDRQLGRTYSTAMAVLALSPPYQFLPIFQR